ncbi:cell division FtsA domain-containing protein [Salinirubellus salinus]|jgi:hypothetical protein|uniref:Cell division FtsA domain-containing protein n=1 Tax=Salinirubellus salinus TaxID=1364945 RepID=A0A9E7QZP1_9EURY|nr:cell division protein FtsA [Salinirubellus salinus]UWM52994.1 cell division FtsA domain-containing protein [Salinirubellus salinus]
MTDETDTDDVRADGGVAPVGVKLGSTRTVAVFPNGEVTEVAESLTCLATYEDSLTGEERVLFGEEAATEYPDRAEYTLRSGLPEDDDRADLTGRFFDAFLGDAGVPTDSAVVYAIPSIDNERGLENLRTVVEGSSVGGRFTRAYPESLCGAVPAMGDGLEAVDEIFVSVNMGSTNLEVSAYRRGEQVAPYATGTVTGNEVDRRIVGYVEEETQRRVAIDITTAREYKEDHADFVDYEAFDDVVQQPGGGSHQFTIEDSVMRAVDEYVDEAVEEVANGFLPKLASTNMKVYQLALEQPVVLTGGMVAIPGLVEAFERRLSEALDREVTAVAPDEPVRAAAVGAQRIAERLAAVHAGGADAAAAADD